MNDARWTDVLESLRISKRHFTQASRIFDKGAPDELTDEGYDRLMAFLHAMQLGYGAYEDALKRTLDILDEEIPTGSDWHASLLDRCARKVPGRPAILDKALLAASQEARSFRHVATHVYEFVFDPDRAARAVAAATIITEKAEEAILTFAEKIDPADEPP